MLLRRRDFCRCTLFFVTVLRDFVKGTVFASLIRLEVNAMIRKLKSGEYRLYSKKKDSKTGKRKNLGTFKSREAAEKHEREVQYFKRH